METKIKDELLMDFEDKLLFVNKLKPTEQLPIKLLCVINTNPATKPRNSQISSSDLYEIMESMNIPTQNNYDDLIEKLKNVIHSSVGRLCRWLGGFRSDEFKTSDFVLITYFEDKDGKKYINGFTTVISCDISNTVRIDYICSDLKFTSIGKILITLIKIILINLRIKKLRLKSILRPTTQNFYTSQEFSPLPEQKDAGYIWFEWNFDFLTEKDDVCFQDFSKKLTDKEPFMITYTPDKFYKDIDAIDKTKLLPYYYSEKEEKKRTEEEESSIFKEVHTPRTDGGKKSRRSRKNKKNKKSKKNRKNRKSKKSRKNKKSKKY